MNTGNELQSSAEISRNHASPDRMPMGFVFATTGDEYTRLARRTARNLRLAMPNAEIDLFTDQPIEDTVFNYVHPVAHDGKRPKMEALRNSRFDKTIYLDADLVVLEDISDVFALLDCSPVVGVLGVSRLKSELNAYSNDIPRSFPVINSGLLGIRNGPRTRKFLRNWDESYASSGLDKDQPVLRGVLYRSGINPLILPQEYNLIQHSMLSSWSNINGGLRGLHYRALHYIKHVDPTAPVSLREVLRRKEIQTLERARAADFTLRDRQSPIYDLKPPKGQRPAHRVGQPGLLRRIKRAIFNRRR